jgi:hypothetical protein
VQIFVLNGCWNLGNKEFLSVLEDVRPVQAFRFGRKKKYASNFCEKPFTQSFFFFTITAFTLKSTTI